MKAAFVCALPFHRWVLEGLSHAFVEAGHKVKTFTHFPNHRRDWLQNHPNGRVIQDLRDFMPDVVIAAEYPYPMLRDAAQAPVVTTRHSLAARGNTWEPEHSEADYVVTWSEYDEELFEQNGVKINALRAGCVWVDMLWLHNQREARERLCWAYELDPDRPIVGWAPTWNEEFQCGEQVRKEIASLPDNVQVITRSHGAVSKDPFLGPWHFMLACDVMVCDVSGIALLALGLPKLPAVVQVDPPEQVLLRSAQYQKWGPEWTMRPELGPRCPGGVGVAKAILQELEQPSDTSSRAVLRDMLIGKPEWTGKACHRALTLIVKAVSSGTIEQSDTTS